VTKHLAEDHASVECNVFVLVAIKGSKQDFALPGDVFDSRPAGTDLSPQEIVENLHDVLPGLEIEARDVDDK
jgi:hypothetical protein